MIKAVFFDVDGTLVSFKEHKVPASTLKAIRDMQEKGIKVFVATGRDRASLCIGNNVDEIDFDGYITLNGQLATTREGFVLHENNIDPEDVRKAVDYALANDIACGFVDENRMFINKITDRVEAVYGSVNLPLPELDDIQKAKEIKIFQVNPFVPETEEEAFMKNMPGALATRWSPLFIDVIPNGGGKHTSVQKVMEHLNLDRNEIMAFGDGGNDKTMIEFAGIGVAMGNGNEHVKEIADYVTDTVDNDGVLKALKHFNVL